MNSAQPIAVHYSPFFGMINERISKKKLLHQSRWRAIVFARANVIADDYNGA